MDTNNSAKVVIKMPFEGSKVVELPEVTIYESFCKLKAMVHMEYAQAINFDFDETVIAFCDEEGKLKNLPFNFNYYALLYCTNVQYKRTFWVLFYFITNTFYDYFLTLYVTF